MNSTGNRARLYGIVALLIHSVLVVLVALEVFKHYVGPGYDEVTQLWYVLVIVDFPSSVVSLSLWALVDMVIASEIWRPSDRTYYITVPSVLFGCIGGVQYYLMPRVFIWLVSKCQEVIRRWGA